MITIYGSQPKLTAEDLRKIETPTPEGAGRRWRAIPHGELVDTVRDAVRTRGWQVGTERYALAREGADLAGAFGLHKVGGVEVPEGQSLSIGFLHSNARRHALKITVGTQVAVCTNGMCSGEVLLRRMHDHSVDLAEEVDDALDRYVVQAKRLAKVVHSLRERALTKAEASEILLEAGRRKLVGWAAVGRVDAEYRHPTFSDHGRDNSWALLNAFTYAARKNINPVRQMATYNAFRGLLPTAANV